MLMTVSRWEATCDTCHSSLPPQTSRHAAAQAAVAEGWNILAGDTVECLACREAAGWRRHHHNHNRPVVPEQAAPLEVEAEAEVEAEDSGTAEVVCFWSTLMRYAREMAEARLTGDSARIIETQRRHDAYAAMCISADRVVLDA